MRKKKYCGKYFGDIVVVGFTGDAEKITDYLKRTFKAKTDKKKVCVEKENFNIELEPDVIAHVEIHPMIWRDELCVN